jgi:nitrate reductase gamma subunit
MNWDGFLETLRGPLFRVAFLVFFAGLAYRLVRVIALGWSRDRVPPMGSRTKGIVTSYAKGIGIFPFIPWVKNTFQGNAVTFLAGAVFHVGLIVIIFLGTAHMLAWKSLLGIGWPTLPIPIIDWLAAITIIAMVALLINRLSHPVVKKLSGTAEFVNWSLVFLPMVTGYMLTHHLFFRYEVMFSLHMLAVDALLLWIPFSRLSHFAFYFFSRTIHGAQFGKRAVTP